MEPNKSSKIGWIIGVIVVVLLIVGAVMVSRSNSDQYADTMPSMTPTPSASPTPTDDTSTTGTQVGVGTGELPITYTEALVAYANERVQFSHPQDLASCNATPQKVTFKGGVKFMLDNRTNSTAIIHFSNGVQYSLPAYSFQIVSLVTPKTYVVDCNSTQNVATVEIQK